MIQPGSVARRLGDLEDYEKDLVGGTRAHARRVFVAYAVLTATGIVTLGLLGTGWFEAIVYAFAAVSTGGFSPHDACLAGLETHLSQAVIIALSIAGGAKIWRLLILMQLLHLSIQRAAMPWDAVSEARLGERRIGPDEIQNALCLVLVFILFTTLSWLPFIVLGHDPLDAIFEVVSAIGTAGLSAGITGPALHLFFKAVLCPDQFPDTQSPSFRLSEWPAFPDR